MHCSCAHRHRSGSLNQYSAQISAKKLGDQLRSSPHDQSICCCRRRRRRLSQCCRSVSLSQPLRLCQFVLLPVSCAFSTPSPPQISQACPAFCSHQHARAPVQPFSQRPVLIIPCRRSRRQGSSRPSLPLENISWHFANCSSYGPTLPWRSPPRRRAVHSHLHPNH
jgi:hypothetical protein